jgi:hypothetical protein
VIPQAGKSRKTDIGAEEKEILEGEARRNKGPGSCVSLG